MQFGLILFVHPRIQLDLETPASGTFHKHMTEVPDESCVYQQTQTQVPQLNALQSVLKLSSCHMSNIATSEDLRLE